MILSIMGEYWQNYANIYIDSRQIWMKSNERREPPPPPAAGDGNT